MGEKDVFFQAHVLMGHAMEREGLKLVNLISPGTGHMIDPKTHAVLWTTSANVRAIGLQASRDRKFDASVAVLVDGVKNVKDPKGGLLMFLRRVPRDPFFAGDADTPPEDTWSLRAFGDPPAHADGSDASERGNVGKDVFDVTSKSDRVGINGIPYRQW